MLRLENRTSLEVFKNKAEGELVFRKKIELCVQNLYKFLVPSDFMLRMQKILRNKSFLFKLPLQMIICGRGAASKLEKNEQTEKNFLNLEDLFGGLLKNCRRQSNLEKRKCKNVINCFYQWKFQLLIKVKNEVFYCSISCSIAYLSPPFHVLNWISKTLQFFDIFKRGI